MKQARIAAVVLAAGSSSRMGGGRHKLLLPLAGRPVLAHVIEAVAASQARPIVVVLGHQSEQVRASIVSETEITFVENPAYLQGMSTSLRVGIQALLDREDRASIDGALIVLGDQPLITAEVLDRLIAYQRETRAPIVAPLYEGQRGTPVLFSAERFPELLRVEGDEGGRSVVERHRDELRTVEVGSALANSDVDTWEAYQQVLESWQRGQA